MEYQVFICYGRGRNRRESGAYTAYGTSYQKAAMAFTSRWDAISGLPPVWGKRWRKTSRRPGYPRSHQFLRDEKGRELLLIRKKSGRS